MIGITSSSNIQTHKTDHYEKCPENHLDHYTLLSFIRSILWILCTHYRTQRGKFRLDRRSAEGYSVQRFSDSRVNPAVCKRAFPSVHPLRCVQELMFPSLHGQ